MTEQNSCVALFGTYSQVGCAVKGLEEAGFDMNDVSIIGREPLQDLSVTEDLPTFSTTLHGIGIPAASIKKYQIALRNRQWLVIVHGAAGEVEHAVDILATGEELEVAVHHWVDGD